MDNLDELLEIEPRNQHSQALEHRHLDGLRNEVDLYRFLAQSKDNDALLDKCHDLLRPLGFSNFAHIMLLPGSDRQNVIQYPSKGHEDLQFYSQDIMIKRGMREDTEIFQSQIAAMMESAPPDQQSNLADIFELNRYIHQTVRDVHIYDYFQVSFPAYNQDARILFTIGTKEISAEKLQERVMRHRSFIGSLGRVMDRVGTTRFNLHGMKLSKDFRNSKALRVLEVMANNQFTTQETADYFGLSIHTINEHLRYAKQCLGARNTLGAILYAQELGLIRIRLNI